MVTPDEIESVPLFSALPAVERERLSRVSADIHLVAGEYIVNEGDERALFAVLDGHIEVVKILDGVDRVLGHRQPGDVFGEVPITLGMPFPAGYRAVEPSRVMRIEVEDYYATAAGGAGSRGQGGRDRARAHRRPPEHRLRAVAAACGRRRRAVRQVVLRAAALPRPQRGRFRVATRPRGPRRRSASPTGRRSSSRCYGRSPTGSGCRPSPRTRSTTRSSSAAGRPGWPRPSTAPPRGCARSSIEREAPGGQAGTSSRIENYLGFPSGVSGDELGRRALQQAKRLGAEILVTRDDHRHRRRDAHRAASTAATRCARARSSSRPASRGGTSRSRASSGSSARASTTAPSRSEAPATHGLDVHLVGAGNSAGQAALFFANHARSVTSSCAATRSRRACPTTWSTSSRPKANIHVALEQRGARRCTASDRLDAIDVARPRRPARRRRRAARRALHLHRRRRRHRLAAATRSRATSAATS